MLDQNTDRMWFVIGAVIVGAAIIFIANGTLPTLFASVADTFEGTSTQTNEQLENLHPNTIIDWGDNLVNIQNYVPGRLYGNNAGSPFTGTPFRMFVDSLPTDATYFISVEPNTEYQLDLSGDTRVRRIVEFGDFNTTNGTIENSNAKSVMDHARYDYYSSQSQFRIVTDSNTKNLGISMRTTDESDFDAEGFTFQFRKVSNIVQDGD